MARKGLAKPVGAMTQYDKIRVGRGAEKKYLKYADIISLASLDDMVFGAWDVYPANAFESAVDAEVLRAKDILPVEDELRPFAPLPAAFDKRYASRLEGDNVKDCATRWDMSKPCAKTSAASRPTMVASAWWCSGRLLPKFMCRWTKQCTIVWPTSRQP